MLLLCPSNTILAHPFHLISHATSSSLSHPLVCLVPDCVSTSKQRRQPTDKRKAEAERIRQKYPDRIPVSSPLPLQLEDVADLQGHLRKGREERYPYNRQEEVPSPSCTSGSKARKCDAGCSRADVMPIGLDRRAIRICHQVSLRTPDLLRSKLTTSRKRIKLAPEKAIFIFVDDILPPTAALMSSIYDEHK